MKETKGRIFQLELEIDNYEYWLSDGRMSNPVKIKYRQRALKKAKKELNDLKTAFK